MVPPDLLKAMLRNVSCEWHRQVIAQGAELAALVGQVVDQLRVLAVLARQDVLALEDGGIDSDGAVAFENGLDCTRPSSAAAARRGCALSLLALTARRWSRGALHALRSSTP